MKANGSAAKGAAVSFTACPLLPQKLLILNASIRSTKSPPQVVSFRGREGGIDISEISLES